MNNTDIIELLNKLSNRLDIIDQNMKTTESVEYFEEKMQIKLKYKIKYEEKLVEMKQAQQGWHTCKYCDGWVAPNHDCSDY